MIEYHAEGRYLNRSEKHLKRDFNWLLNRISEASQGKGIAEGLVPWQEFWLIDGAEFIGNLKIRYHLSESLWIRGGNIGYDIRPSKRKQGYGYKILELGLRKARTFGLDPALITCMENNVASRKIIEAHGGRYLRKTIPEKTLSPELIFWI